MTGVAAAKLSHYRYRIDGKLVNTAPTWGAAEDTTYFPGYDSPFRLRVAIDNSTGAAAAGTGTLQFRLNGGTWTTLTTATTPVKVSDLGASATVLSTTAITTAALRLTVPGAGAAQAGGFIDGATTSSGLTNVAAASYTEWEVGLQLIDSGLAPTDLVEFRGVGGGGAFTALTGPDLVPSITMPADPSAQTGATTYQLSNTASGLTGETVNGKLEVTGAAGTWAPTLTSASGGLAEAVLDASFFTDAGVDVTGNTAGQYVVCKVNVTTGNTNVRWEARAIRVNSTGVVQAYGPNSASTSAGATGAYTLNAPLFGLGTFASTDRLRIDVRARNTAATAGQSFTITYASANSSVAFMATAGGGGGATTSLVWNPQPFQHMLIR